MHLGPITQEKTERPQMWQKAMPDFLGNWYPARHIACEWRGGSNQPDGFPRIGGMMRFVSCAAWATGSCRLQVLINVLRRAHSTAVCTQQRRPICLLYSALLPRRRHPVWRAAAERRHGAVPPRLHVRRGRCWLAALKSYATGVQRLPSGQEDLACYRAPLASQTSWSAATLLAACCAQPCRCLPAPLCRRSTCLTTCASLLLPQVHGAHHYVQQRDCGGAGGAVRVL